MRFHPSKRASQDQNYSPNKDTGGIIQAGEASPPNAEQRSTVGNRAQRSSHLAGEQQTCLDCNGGKLHPRLAAEFHEEMLDMGRDGSGLMNNCFAICGFE